MVKGLDIFKEHFAAHKDKFVLIGGAASTIIMEEAGLAFRATKDLDLLLCIEAFNVEFAQIFWDFVKKGKYSNLQQSTGKRLYYRFHSPELSHFPEMLELFSRVPDALSINHETYQLTPIPVDEETSSLSAILLDPDYYAFIQSGVQIQQELPVVGADRLIPLKARACLDLSARYSAGERVDSRNIRKHRNDIIRLSTLLSPTDLIDSPLQIKNDLKKFLQGLNREEKLNLKSLGIRSGAISDIIRILVKIYSLT